MSKRAKKHVNGASIERPAGTLAEQMMQRFAGFATAYGTHGTPKQDKDSLKWAIKSTASTLSAPVTLELWEEHLAGKKPLGVIPIREDGMCVWGSIDYDVYDADLLKLIGDVEKMKLPLVPCRSKSGGLHLFAFLDDWTPALIVQASLRDIAAQIGIAKSEIFPKQTQILAERGDLGSWMIMPYYGDTYGGKLKEQVGLKRSGGEMLIEEFLDAAYRTTVNGDKLASFARKRPSVNPDTGRSKQAAPGVEYPDPDVPFGDGPVCLQTMANNGVPRGVQNNVLLNMGTYFKRHYPDDWKAHLNTAAREYLTPPGSAEGTASTIKSLEKKDDYYTCKTTPMCDFCNSALCRTRPFGVGEADDFPISLQITMMHSDPPVWFVEMEGEHRVELNTDQLFTYGLFQKASMEQGQKVFLPMTQKDWVVVLKDAMERVSDIPMPEDVGERGQLMELIEEFLVNRYRGTEPEDLLQGRPYLNDDDNHYYFRLSDMQRFMQREGMKNVTRTQIMTRLRRIIGKENRILIEDRFLNVKGRGVRCWRLPRESISEPVELNPPPKQESGI